jgi:hypothetical protein
MKKTARNIVGIVIVIHIFMVATMVGRPSERRAFKGRRTEKQRVELYDRARLKGEMGKEAMVAQRDAHRGRNRKVEKKTDLETTQPVMPYIEWHRCKSDNKGTNEEEGVRNSDFTEKLIHSYFVEIRRLTK